jgi:hypothetical protein
MLGHPRMTFGPKTVETLPPDRTTRKPSAQVAEAYSHTQHARKMEPSTGANLPCYLIKLYITAGTDIVVLNSVSLSQLLVYTGFVILAVAVLYGLKPSSKRKPKLTGNRISLRRILDRLGLPVHHDVRIVDQQGRIICIEHVLRLPASVLLIGTIAEAAEGEIRGTEHSRTWKITHRGASTTCVNPQLELQPLMLAFKRRFPLLRVRGLVVFPDTVSFPDGEPRGSVRASDFERWIKALLKTDGTVSQAAEQAWPAIAAMIRNSRTRIDQARSRGQVVKDAGVRHAARNITAAGR